MLKQLRVHGLRGYKDEELKISFNEDLNILTGRNGSGKTTALKLVWYLLSGNFSIAADETPFSVATLVTDLYSMTVDLSDGMPSVVIDMNGEELIFRRRTTEENDEFDFFDVEEENTLEEAANFIKDFGSSLFFPTFRRVEGGYTIPRDTRFSPVRNALARHRGKSPIDEAFDEISRRLTKQEHRFICSVSTNDIVNLVLNRLTDATTRYSSAQQSLSNNIIKQIRNYERKEETLGLDSADGVIKRIKLAIEQVDKQRIELMSSLNAVQDLVVRLFDHQGISFASRYAFGEVTESTLAENLSAGEKQMLSFICYNAFYSDSVIFIDEPELSLHVDWQRQLFPILEAQATTNQFVISTHSPFIYSKYPEKEILLGNDRGD
jgi:predicted ATP-binding protein involved in virulence